MHYTHTHTPNPLADIHECMLAGHATGSHLHITIIRFFHLPISASTSTQLHWFIRDCQLIKQVKQSEA